MTEAGERSWSLFSCKHVKFGEKVSSPNYHNYFKSHILSREGYKSLLNLNRPFTNTRVFTTLSFCLKRKRETEARGSKTTQAE